MKPPIYKKTAPKLDAIMSEIERVFIPPFYETPTQAEIAAATGIPQSEVNRYLRTLVKTGRLLQSERGKVVPPPNDALTRWKKKDVIGDLLAAHNPAPSIIAHSIAQAAPTPEQTASGREWLDHRE